MATLKRLTRRPRGESLRGAFMIDTVRGVLRIRKWPKKRGTPKSAKQRWWNDWFTQANYLAKYVDGATAARAIEITAGSGMYPRDIILSAMRGRLYRWIDQDGKVWNSMAAAQDISDSLDVLSQLVGSVLVRAVDRWRAPPAGVINDVLTYKGAAAPPVWQAPAGGGGGVTQEELAGSPIAVDGTQSQYDFDVSTYSMIDVAFEGIGFAASDRPCILLSNDGGTTFKNGASDYYITFFHATTTAAQLFPNLLCSSNVGAAGHNSLAHLTNLRAGRAAHGCDGSMGTLACRTAGFPNFTGPITDIRIQSVSGNNFNAGTLRVVGIK